MFERVLLNTKNIEKEQLVSSLSDHNAKDEIFDNNPNELPKIFENSEENQKLNNNIENYNQGLATLASTVGQFMYDSWLSYLKFERLEGSNIVLNVPSKLIRDFIINNYLRQVLTAVQTVNPNILIIDIRCPEQSQIRKTGVERNNNHNYNNQQSETKEYNELDNYGYDNLYIQKSTNHSPQYEQKQQKYLNPNYKQNQYSQNNLQYNNDGLAPSSNSNRTKQQAKNHLNDNIFSQTTHSFIFDNFVFNSVNQAAYFACIQVAEYSEYEVTGQQYSRGLCIYGEVGNGKTHLLQSVIHSVAHHSPHLKVGYMTVEKFTRIYVASVKNGNFLEFRNKIAALDIFILDDLQFIVDKASTTREFFNILDEISAAGKYVIFSCDRHPQALNLEPRYKSRISGCMNIEIGKVDFDLRFNVLQRKLKSLTQTISVSNQITIEMLEKIAFQEHYTIRETEAILQKFLTHCELLGIPATEELLEVMIGENALILYQTLNNPDHLTEKRITNQNSTIKRNKSTNSLKTSSYSRDNSTNSLNDTKKQMAITTIIESVAEYYCFATEDLASKARSAKLSIARQVASYLLSQKLSLSLKQIGKILGGRSHATIIHMNKSFAYFMEMHFGRASIILQEVNALLKKKNTEFPT